MAAVAPVRSQHDVHPLLRHPRPITGDFAKAQRMLGLVSDSEEKLNGLQRQKSKTTKWLERPLYANPEMSDVESEKEHEQYAALEKDLETAGNMQDRLLLEQWNNPNRPTSFHSENAIHIHTEPKSKVDPASLKRRPQPLAKLRPVSYHAQHLLSPDWTASPATMSPGSNPAARHIGRGSISSISSSGSVVRHPQTWPSPAYHAEACGERQVSHQPSSSMMEHEDVSPFASPRGVNQRPRPTSFATYQQRDRRNSKIASSRGLRNNSYPNFSHPGVGPKVVPGESIESDALFTRFAGNEIGPPSPASPIHNPANVFDAYKEAAKDESKPKKRWSAIPQTFKKFARRRSSAAAEQPRAMEAIEQLRRTHHTEPNQPVYENYSPATPTAAPPSHPLPTPSYSPLEFRFPAHEAPLPKPFAPWTETPPSPALSFDKRRSCDMSLSPTRRRRTSSRLSVENVLDQRPVSIHSRNSSFGMPSPMHQTLAAPPVVMFDQTTSSRPGSRRGTPVVLPTCILCKTTKEPAAFVSRRITGNCWHEPATCYDCLKIHIEKCVTTKGWDDCTCPECGEKMTYDDLGAFADDDSLIKWEDD